MIIYERLRNLREDHDLTQQEIADILQIDRKTYLRYEKGLNEIKIDLLVKLARYYKVSTDFICGLTDQSKTNENKSPKTKQELTAKQIALVNNYENNPDLQKAVDKLLDIK